jgi:hypothetical protein
MTFEEPYERGDTGGHVSLQRASSSSSVHLDIILGILTDLTNPYEYAIYTHHRYSARQPFKPHVRRIYNNKWTATRSTLYPLVARPKS